MSSLSLTHTSVDGALLIGTLHGDGSARILRHLGWRWTRQAQCWYIPASRGRHPQQNLIGTTITRLEALGLTMTLNLDADDQSSLYSPHRANGGHAHTGLASTSPADTQHADAAVMPRLNALSKETVAARDTVMHDGQWLKVLRANEKTVTVLLRDDSDPVRYSYIGLQGHRPANRS